MLSWFIKRGVDKRLHEFNSSIKNSFSSLKQDMSQVSEWIGHFKERHDEHTTKFNSQEEAISNLLERIHALEQMVYSETLESEDKNILEELPEEEVTKGGEPTKKQWEALTETQKLVFLRLHVLVSESPNSYVSLKALGQDVYPDREYYKIRSTVSQFITALESFGFVNRRKKGKNMFVTTLLKPSKADLLKVK